MMFWVYTMEQLFLFEKIPDLPVLSAVNTPNEKGYGF